MYQHYQIEFKFTPKPSQPQKLPTSVSLNLELEHKWVGFIKDSISLWCAFEIIISPKPENCFRVSFEDNRPLFRH